jgi:hypothetical protein
MMDYTAGQSRLQGSAASNESGAASSLNPTRPRMQSGVSMNISTGGAHVLLFERDQQFAALLSSELQLVGYECHTARTAVEVFDAIARYSIRLVLVNLAQAAAARREFWVALDTQRRGRGVQVLTFHCSNLAGYGPISDDPDDRSHTMLADLEVDGMLGIMNMVNAIRSRLAISGTGAMPRLASNTGNDAGQRGTTATGERSKIQQTTIPLPAATNSGGASPSARSAPSQPLAAPNVPSARPSSSGPAAEVSPSPHTSSTNPVNHPDKIRAVIYPNQRSWSTQREADSPQNQNMAQVHTNAPAAPVSLAASPVAPVDAQTKHQETAWGPQAPAESHESSLAQLSRMVEEHRVPAADTTRATSNGQEDAPLSEATMQRQRVRPPEATSISDLPLRASPIEDMPTERIAPQPDGSGPGNTYANDSLLYQPFSTLASIATPVVPVSPMPGAAVPLAEPAMAAPPAVTREPEPAPSLPTKRDDREEEQGEHLKHEAASFSTRDMQQQRTAVGQNQQQDLTEQMHSMIQEQTQQRPLESGQEESSTGGSDALTERVHVQPQQRSEAKPVQPAKDSSLLLDIVQSLPSMPPPPSQQQVLSGRATRSLGSVLLEGHLVPQDRLEVAHGIQRMLRGVDMNYQLGEILLMFKLLTPDQLLAASLVSYGLITTTQIIALGRIRQELHSIGLEYDLENLLILFRILTSEQLREVRSTWAS